MSFLHPTPTPSPHPILSPPELLAPAGNWDCARAAVENGANAIYFGLDRFNARMRADNFTEADLPELMAWLHQRGVKGYVTLNTLIFTDELARVEEYLKTIITAGVDAVIVQDVGLCRLIRHLSPDFPIHASTQMTITSAAGVTFARDLGCQLAVLARECSLNDIGKIQQHLQQQDLTLPLEVFVHGALCVAYSGQCLTSEALGGRSANRGECAQACRMPYDLIADGQPVDLGGRQYLLSPQDLSGLAVLPDLVASGVCSLKIEGRLKSPDYVANVTRVYRQALDRISAASASSTPSPLVSPSPRPPLAPASPTDHYQLEMAFSRGLHTGWFGGIDNQQLVHARFGKKRGVYLGQVNRVRKDGVTLRLEAPAKPGDGVVFDHGHPAAKEEGGRLYQVEPDGVETRLRFGRHDINLRRIQVGDRVWKTSDPALEKDLRQTYSGDQPKFQRPLDLEIHGILGHPLTIIARDGQGHIVQVDSAMALAAAHSQPLTLERLQQQLGRLGGTPFCLGQFRAELEGDLMLPVSELNRLRRELVEQILQQRAQPRVWQLDGDARFSQLLPPSLDSGNDGGSEQCVGQDASVVPPSLAVPLSPRPPLPASPSPHLIPLVRTRPQLEAALRADIDTIYCEFENPATYRETVQWFRANRRSEQQTLWLAPPRITKPLETYILDQVKRAEADGYLVRNYDHLAYFTDQRCVGDFSLNVANPLTAAYFIEQFGLERITASYDLNAPQLETLLQVARPTWFDITLHQHMPMFHMEHCVFCAFLSNGKDFRDCGRPCETHQVTLQDRVGTEHPLLADAGCRNTVFNGVAQTGAEYAQRLLAAGARYFRIEFLHETPAQVSHTLEQYQRLLAGELSGAQLWRSLKLQSQLGVTRGPLNSA